MPQSFTKDEEAQLDYKFDFTAWLPAGDTIATHTVTPETGLTVDSSDITDDGTSVTAWIGGGIAGAYVRVTCHIVTAQGREDDRTVTFRIEER